MPVSPGQANFAAGVLKGIGAPVTPANIAGFVGWAQAEGGWGHNNPLNTTQPAAGAGNFNSVGVKAYPNPQVGVQATIQTLKNGHYGGILQAFRSNNPRALAGAIGSSPWGTSGSLAAQTISQALGEHINLPAGAVKGIVPAAPGQRTTTQRVGTTIGGGLNTDALAQAILTKEASKPIETSAGKPASQGNPLQDYVSAMESGQFNVPSSPATDVIHGTLRQGTLGHLTSHAGNVNPLGAGWTIGRTDQGVDASARPGTPIHAINDSRVVDIQHNWYAGQPLVLMQLTAGPDAGKYWYVAEQINHNLHVGQHIAAGQVVATYAPTGTGIEIGWGHPGGGDTLAQAEGNTGGPRHSNSPAGIDFAHKILGR